MSFLTYDFAGERWRVENGDTLLADYDLAPKALPEWHRVMAEAGQAFAAVRQTYGIFDVMKTSDPELMHPRTPAEIAKSLGLKAPAVTEILAAAVDYWKTHCRHAGGAASGVQDLPAPPELALSAEECQKILAAYNLVIEDPPERLIIARRCVELRTFLEQELLRSTALSLIQQERHLGGLDMMIAAETKKKEEANRKVVMEMMEKRSGLQEKIEKSLERLGIWDTPDLMGKRKTFALSIAAIAAGMQAYYARGDRELLDGVHAEGEIEVLLRAFDLRAPQYRPDLVLLAPAAIEGLWEENYVPPAMPRHVHRRLGKAFRAAIASARQEDGVDVEELDRDPGDDE